MRRAVVVVSLWLALAVVSTGVGLATVGVLQQRVGEAVSRPLTSAEVSAALDDESETLPAVPGLTRPTDDGDDDDDDRSASPSATRAVTFAPAGDDDADQGSTSGSDDVATTPRPAVTADPSRSAGSGSSGSSGGSGSSDEQEADREDRPSRSPRPSSTERDDEEDRPSSSSPDRSGRDLARSATSTRRTTTLSRLHRPRVTTTPHRHVVRHTVRHRVVRGDDVRHTARGITRR